MKIKIIVSIIIFLSISLVSYSQNIYIDYALQKIINSNKIQTPHDENGIRIINKNPCIDIAIKDSSYYILFNNNMAILNINGESEMYNLPRNAAGQISQYSSDIFKHNRDFNLLIKGKKSLWIIDKKNLVFLKIKDNLILNYSLRINLNDYKLTTCTVDKNDDFWFVINSANQDNIYYTDELGNIIAYKEKETFNSKILKILNFNDLIYIIYLKNNKYFAKCLKDFHKPIPICSEINSSEINIDEVLCNENRDTLILSDNTNKIIYKYDKLFNENHFKLDEYLFLNNSLYINGIILIPDDKLIKIYNTENLTLSKTIYTGLKDNIDGNFIFQSCSIFRVLKFPYSENKFLLLIRTYERSEINNIDISNSYILEL
jgi:hypothetical protein